MASEIEVLERLLAKIEEPITKIEKDKAALDEKLQPLLAERYGLQLALARVKGEPQPQPQSVVPAGSFGTGKTSLLGLAIDAFSAMRRTDAILSVLGEAETPMDRQEITRALIAKGRHDKPDDVSAALAYLVKQGKLVKLADGGWVTQERFAETAEARQAAG